jgi:hypothetical protein
MKKLFFIFAAQAQEPARQVSPPPPPLPSLDNFAITGGWMSASWRGFTMDGRAISVRQAKEYAQPYKEAIRHIRAGQGWMVGGTVLAAIGGYFVGHDLGMALTGKKITGAGIAVGLAVFGGGMGLTAITVSQYRKAAAAYNSAVGLVWLPERGPILDLTPTPGGLGLQLTF